MKYCPCCKEILPLELYSRANKRKGGLSVYCKPCCKIKRDALKEESNKRRNQKWKDDPEYREYYLAYHRERYVREKDQLRAYQTAHYSVPINKIKYMTTNAKSRANKMSWEYDLDHTKIHIPTHCKYLGMELTYTHKQGRKDSNASLDRIDNTRGYTMDNVQIISDKANRMKNDSSINELKQFALNVLKEHN